MFLQLAIFAAAALPATAALSNASNATACVWSANGTHINATNATACIPDLNATDAASGPKCAPLPTWGAPFGIFLGSIASVGINIGQNMQADGIRSLPEAEQHMPWKGMAALCIVGRTLLLAFIHHVRMV